MNQAVVSIAPTYRVLLQKSEWAPRDWFQVEKIIYIHLYIHNILLLIYWLSTVLRVAKSGMCYAGFEEGISDMRPGGKRRIIIPPELGPPVNSHTIPVWLCLPFFFSWKLLIIASFMDYHLYTFSVVTTATLMFLFCCAKWLLLGRFGRSSSYLVIINRILQFLIGYRQYRNSYNDQNNWVQYNLWMCVW